MTAGSGGKALDRGGVALGIGSYALWGLFPAFWPLRGLGLRGWATVAAASVFIAVNWGLYIYGVSIDLVVEAALGYYMSPLVSVLLGVLVLGVLMS